MATSLAALAVLAVILAAQWVAPPGWLVALAVCAGAAALIAVLRGRCAGAPISLVCMALLRAASPEAPEGTAPRGLPPAEAVVVLDVLGAAQPGPSCDVRVASPQVRSVSLREAHCDFAAGDRIAVPAREWATAVRIRAAPQLRHGWLHARGGPGYWRSVVALRQLAWERGRRDPSAAFVAAATLGVRRALEPSTRRTLRRAGLAHLVAVSGMHVGLMALWFLFVLERAVFVARLDGWRWVAPAGAALLVVAHVGLTGASASAVRAGIMALVVLMGRAVGRPHHARTLILVTAAAMLAWQPRWIRDVGFLLSFAATAALLTAQTRRLLGLGARIAWWTAPIAVASFGFVAWVGVPLGVVAIPLFSAWVLPLGVVGWLVESIAPGPVADALLKLAEEGARWLLDLARLGARVPPWGAVATCIAAWTAFGVRALLRGRSWPALRDALPGGVPAVAITLVVALPGELVPTPNWALDGGARSKMVVTRRGRLACVRNPRGDGAAVARAVGRLGWSEVGRVEGRPGPALRILREDLDGGLATGLPCPEADPEAGTLHRRCRFRAGGRRGAVRRTILGVQCRVDRRWVRLPVVRAADARDTER